MLIAPQEQGFGGLIGKGLSESLEDFSRQQQNKKFFRNLAEQLKVENPEKFSETFASISPDQFGQLLYQSRYTGLPQMLGLGGMPTGQAPTEGMEKTERREILKQNFDDMIKTLRENIDVTNVGYGLKTAVKSGFKIPTGSFDPRVQAFKVAGDAAVVIAEELFREAAGRGLTQRQTDYVQNNFKVTPDMTTAQAEAVINRLEKLYKGVLPKDFPGIEEIKQETTEKKFSPKKIEEKQKMQPPEKLEGLPEAKNSKGLTYRDEETGKRYRSDGTKWTLVKG